MKKLIILALLVCGFSAAYSQDDCYDKVAKQAVEIDSLRKVIRESKKDFESYKERSQNIIHEMQGQIRILQRDSLFVRNFKQEEMVLQNLLQRKNNEIKQWGTIAARKDSINTAIRQESDRRANQRYQEGKNETLFSVINTYRNKTFDSLIRSSTKESVLRDWSLVGNNAEVQHTLSDLQQYFSAKELLDKQFNNLQIRNAQDQLQSINQQSKLLAALKEKLNDYELCSNGLKTTINKIKEIDQNIPAHQEKIRKIKLEDILSELSWYIFNYNFNLNDYPYLSGIVLEIIKRKQQNANANISDLSTKL
jgi:hypothetical protein